MGRAGTGLGQLPRPAVEIAMECWRNEELRPSAGVPAAGSVNGRVQDVQDSVVASWGGCRTLRAQWWPPGEGPGHWGQDAGSAEDSQLFMEETLPSQRGCEVLGRTIPLTPCTSLAWACFLMAQACAKGFEMVPPVSGLPRPCSLFPK